MKLWYETFIVCVQVCYETFTQTCIPLCKFAMKLSLKLAHPYASLYANLHPNFHRYMQVYMQICIQACTCMFFPMSKLKKMQCDNPKMIQKFDLSFENKGDPTAKSDPNNEEQ